jgi:predicted nucleotidyltransferase
MSLSALLFNEYRRKVLGLLLLHPEARYHLREISRLTGTQPGTLTRELNKLAEAGLLLKERQGNQVLYAANRACPIYQELAGILRKTSGLADVLREALLPIAAKVQVAFVFGSMASGKATSDSDIDLMVIGDCGFGEVVARLYPSQAELQREINPKVYSVREWQELVAGQAAFVRDLLNKPQLFVLGNEALLLELGGQG